MRRALALVAAVVAVACTAGPAAAAARTGSPGIRVDAAGWWWPAIEVVPAGAPVARLGLQRGSVEHYLDAQRNAAVVGGTLTALWTISLFVPA